MTRAESFMMTVSVLLSGRSVEIVGERGSGRTHFLQRLQEHFTTLGWTVLKISGVESFQRANFAALDLAGFLGGPESRVSPVAAVYRSIEARLGKGSSLILIDDCDNLDDASWGVISAVSAQKNVPIVLARLRNGSMSAARYAASPLVSTFTQHLNPMGYVELEARLSSTLGSRIEASTMSRVYAKTAGNIGIALTLVEAAIQAGSFESGGALARFTGPVWTPALSAVMESVLHPLDSGELTAVRTLALLGSIDYDSARKIVDEETLSALEATSFITTVTDGNRRIVAVNPPLLIDYFRHEVPRGQRDAFLNEVDSALNVEPALTHNSPAFVQVVHEHAQLRTLRAQLAWEQQPSLPHATTFLYALTSDIRDVSDEVEALLYDAALVEGTPSERAEFEVAYASHLTNQYADRLDEASDRLAAASLALPSESVWLDARLSLLRAIYLRPGSELPLDNLSERSMDSFQSDVRADVLATRVLWLLLRGRVREASEMLVESNNWNETTPHLDIVIVFCDLAMGDYRSASQFSSKLLGSARKSFDGPSIMVTSFLAALSALFEKRFNEVETIIEDAAAIGLASGESTISYIGLTILAAYTSARRGQRSRVSERLAELEASGYPDSAIPLQQRAWVLAQMRFLDGDADGAARLCRETADELWESGARLAAAYLYIDGIRLGLARNDFDHAAPRLAEIDSPEIEKLTDFSRALVEGDVEALHQAAQQAANDGYREEAVHAARLSLRHLATEGGVVPATAASEGLRRIAELGGDDSNKFEVLSPREIEVAKLVASGLSNPAIAETLVLSTRTVETHINRLIRKIGGKRRQDISDYLLGANPNS